MKTMRLSDSKQAPVLVEEDVPQPHPRRGELLIRVYAAGVTPTELLWYPTTHGKDGEKRSRTVPGHEFSGVIAAAGEDAAAGFDIGQEVYGMTMFAERGGVSSRDIIRISMGSDTNTRVMAVKTGAAHATTVDPGGLVFAQREGLVSLGFLGDLFPMPFQGFVTTERKIRENPGQIKRWLKGAIRGLMGAVSKALGKALKGSVVTSTLVAVTALAVPGLVVEIESMGVVGS